MDKTTFALVIAQRGHLKNGLQSLLRTIPQIEIIAESQDPTILSKIGKEIHPDLIVIEANFIGESCWDALSALKVECPQTKILVLTDSDDQGKKALISGADFSLPKGFPAADLVSIIESSFIYKTMCKSKNAKEKK